MLYNLISTTKKSTAYTKNTGHGAAKEDERRIDEEEVYGYGKKGDRGHAGGWYERGRCGGQEETETDNSIPG